MIKPIKHAAKKHDTTRAETAIQETGMYGFLSAVEGNVGVSFVSAMAEKPWRKDNDRQ
jgi:hypothetical protein